MFNIRYLKPYTKHPFICCFAVFLLVSSCKSPDKLIGDSNVFGDTNIEDSDIDPEDEPSSFSSVSDLFSGDTEEGSIVFLTDITVTSPSDDSGFFVGDQSGGPNSGIFVQADFEQKSAFDVSIGQTVNIEGTYLEIEEAGPDSTGFDNTLSTISISNVADVAVTGVSQTPVQAVSFESALSSEIEAYEGVLVSILSPTLIIDNNLVYINNTLVLNNRYYQYSESELLDGTVNEIIGVIGYENGKYVLYPRSAEDIDITIDDFPAVELSFTEFFVGNPDAECLSGLEWFIELHYSLANLSLLNDISENIYISNRNDNEGYLQYSKVILGPGEISPSASFVISNLSDINCLKTPSSEPLIITAELAVVGSEDPLTSVHQESIFTLMLSDNDASVVGGNAVVLDEVVIDVGFGLNSYELSTLATQDDNYFLNPNNGFWSESTTPLINLDDVQILDAASGSLIHGSPGTLTPHSSK